MGGSIFRYGRSEERTVWKTVRVSERTLRSLERVRESMLAGDASAILPLDSKAARSGLEDVQGRIGLDRVIRRLIADRLRWQRRRRAARQGGKTIQADEGQ